MVRNAPNLTKVRFFKVPLIVNLYHGQLKIRRAKLWESTDTTSPDVTPTMLVKLGINFNLIANDISHNPKIGHILHVINTDKS